MKPKANTNADTSSGVFQLVCTRDNFWNSSTRKVLLPLYALMNCFTLANTSSHGLSSGDINNTWSAPDVLRKEDKLNIQCLKKSS
eukprot:g8327.t1